MKHVLIDGFNLAFRMFHGMPAFSRSDGFPVNAILGWVRTLWKLQDQEGPCAALVFFDKEGSRRHLELHADYKAQRPEMPEALARQIPELKSISAHLGLRVIEEAGVEADDLIASAAAALAGAGHAVRIASTDKDFAQCVNERVLLLVPPPSKGPPKAGWATLDAAGVEGKFGVPPEKIVDYLSLIGDAADNIPGVPGVGPKTALAWLAAHGDVAGILAARDRILPERFRDVLRDCEGVLSLNRQLICFRTDFPGDWECGGVADDGAARAFFERMEMRGTLKEFENRHQGQLELGF